MKTKYQTKISRWKIIKENLSAFLMPENTKIINQKERKRQWKSKVCIPM